MYLSVVRPQPEDPPLTFARRWLAREALHLPVKARMALNPEFPWLAADAVRWLEGFLKPGMRALEWGAGRSTVFLARRVAEVVSVEHKAKWRRRVLAALEEKSLANVDLRFHPPEPDLIPPEPPPVYKPGFAAYARAVLDQADDSLDLLLIDGRSRVACAHHGLAKLKPGGTLVLDNSERPKYHPIYVMVRGWPCTVFANGVWRTTIFTKPS